MGLQDADKLNPTVLDAIKRLRELRELHIDLASAVLPGDMPMLSPDIFIITTINRSMSLLAGFCSLIESCNFIAAAPLVRLQLDTCLRIMAMHISEDAHEFTLSVMKGNHIRKMKDRNNKLMTDRYLVEKMNEDFPWVEDVYANMSGYIHMSDKHIFNALRAEAQEGHISLKVSDTDAFITDDMYIESIEIFLRCIDILHSYVMGYVDWKRKEHGPPSGPTDSLL